MRTGVRWRSKLENKYKWKMKSMLKTACEVAYKAGFISNVKTKPLELSTRPLLFSTFQQMLESTIEFCLSTSMEKGWGGSDPIQCGPFLDPVSSC